MDLPADFGWSISSLSTINQCGRLWQLKYLSDTQPEEGRELPQFAFGRAVHKLLEEIHLRGYWNVYYWIRLWDEVWAENAKEVDWDLYPGRKKNYERLGPDLLAAYTEREENKLADIVCLEQRFEVEIEGHNVKGVVDQIRRTPEGLLLIDFKTSKEPLHPLVERTDPQLTLYAYVCKLLYDELPRVAHYYLRSGDLVVTDRSEEDMELVLAMIREAQQRVEQKQFTRQLGWHCNDCTYRGPCLGPIGN